MPRKIILTPPITEEQARELVCGDIVYINGTVFAWRDRASERMMALADRGEKIPFELEGSVHWHCGPIVQQTPSGWTISSAGPTGSMRFSGVEGRAIQDFGVRLVVGKSGMSAEVRAALRSKGAAFLAAVGGGGSLYAKQIRHVRQIEWLDLGLPEAFYTLEMKDFGPLLVAMDSHGESLYEKVRLQEKLEELCAEIDSRRSVGAMDWDC